MEGGFVSGSCEVFSAELQWDNVIRSNCDLKPSISSSPCVGIEMPR